MDLHWLTTVVEAGGPVASVHLDTTRASESGEHEQQLRWAAAREQLEADGAPEDLVDSLAERLLEPTGAAGRHGRSVLATTDAVLLDVLLPTPPLRSSGAWGVVPHLMPLVRALDPVVPYALVEVDHEGAAVHAVDPRTRAEETHEVAGGHDVLHKYGGGGWSHRRFQMRVEDSWDRNAEAVLADLRTVVARHRPEVVLLAGDPYSRGVLRREAGGELADLLVDLDTGGRADGVDPDAFAAAVDAALAQVSQRQMGEVVAAFEAARGRGGAAADGLAHVVAAVQGQAVETLLLHDDPSSTSTLWAGQEPSQLGVSEAQVRELGAQESVEDRADAVLLRALVAQGAAVQLVEGGVDLADGVGAVLRYDIRPPVPGRD